MTDVLRGFVIGITADRRSDRQISVLEGYGAACVHGPTVCSHPRDNTTSTTMPGRPSRTGADSIEIRDSMPTDLAPAQTLVRAVCERRVDALTFTEGAAVDNLVEIATGLGRYEALAVACRSSIRIFCLGRACASEVVVAGLGEPLRPARSRLEALMSLVSSTLATSDSVVRLGGVAVTIRGRSVAVDAGEPVALVGRERQVLERLLERPGVVHSKESLLATIWGRDEADVHAVEVTVGRLRQRLGPAGVGIETVIRRGYRADATIQLA